MPYFTNARVLGRTLMVGLFGLAATSASAADEHLLIKSREGVTKSVIVRFADLDLTSSYGRARLDWRVEQAARSACHVIRGSEVDKLPGAQTCLTQARASAYAALEAQGVQSERLALR